MFHTWFDIGKPVMKDIIFMFSHLGYGGSSDGIYLSRKLAGMGIPGFCILVMSTIRDIKAAVLKLHFVTLFEYLMKI